MPHTRPHTSLTTDLDTTRFDTEGFLVCTLDIEPELRELRGQIFDLFNFVSTQAGGPAVTADREIVDFYRRNQPMQHQAVKLCWGLPALLALGRHPALLDTLARVGLRRPLLEIQPLLRCDMPVEDQHIFHQHQDFTYNIGSLNSVTFWLPLSDVDVADGALQVAAGSHRAGTYTHDNGIIPDRYRFDFRPQPVRFGQALLFHQKLVHASGRNTSRRVRLSIQLRYCDLACPDFIARGWPLNHKTTTETFALPDL